MRIRNVCISFSLAQLQKVHHMLDSLLGLPQAREVIDAVLDNKNGARLFYSDKHTARGVNVQIRHSSITLDISSTTPLALPKVSREPRVANNVVYVEV